MRKKGTPIISDALLLEEVSQLGNSRLAGARLDLVVCKAHKAYHEHRLTTSWLMKRTVITDKDAGVAAVEANTSSALKQGAQQMIRYFTWW